jgi:hypothetical protein
MDLQHMLCQIEPGSDNLLLCGLSQTRPGIHMPSKGDYIIKATSR